MAVIVTQNPKDVNEYTITVYNDHEGTVFSDLAETLAELIVHDESLAGTQEETIIAETKVEMLAEFMQYLKDCIDDGFVHTIVQCGKVVKNATTHELFVLGHVSNVIKNPKLEFVSAKWWDDPKHEAEVIVRMQ